MTDKEIAKDILVAMINGGKSGIYSAEEVANAYTIILNEVKQINPAAQNICSSSRKPYDPLDDL